MCAKSSSEKDSAAHEIGMLRAIVGNARDAILVTESEPVDEPGPRIVYANASFSEMTGYSLEEVRGKTPRILQGPETNRAELDRLRAALKRWRPARVELANRRKDGSLFWVELEIVPVADETGWYTHWVSIQREITDRKKAEQERKQSEDRLRAALEKNASDVVAIVEPDGTLRYGSPSMRSVLGISPEELVGESVFTFVHPEDAEPVRERFAEVVANPGVNQPLQFRFCGAGGSWRSLEAVGNNMLADPGVRGVIVNAWDVSARKRVEDALYLRDRAIAASSNGIIITDSRQVDNPIVYVNPKFEQITGYSAEDALGRNCRFLRDSNEDQPGVDELRIAIAEGREWSGPLRNYRKDGKLFWNELYIAPVRDEEGTVTNFVGVQKDITERKVLEERLAFQAFHDDLTHLPNRTLFLERLGRALSHAGRSGWAAVLFMDLDNFKVINDSLGHEAGDRLLVEVAERLKAALRPEDSVARLGGDEFVVLLEGVESPEAAEKVARRVARTLQAPFTLEGQEIFATTSVGIALGYGGQERPGDLLRNADLAMYRAKSRGKNHYQLFEPGMDERARERLRLESDLRQALQRDELVVHYQPQVSLASGETVGVEALARWERPGFGLVPPAEFIPLAEETGLIVPLGLKVLREACRQAHSWQGSPPESEPLTVSVNLSARQFRHPRLAEDVAGALEESGLDPCLLILEITESVAMEDAPATVTALGKLKDLGVKLAVDDFGTGYSSLSYLRRFPVDYLKIDRSFVWGLEGSAEGKGLVSATVGLAHLLGLEAVAEGVETAEQAARLAGMGCELAQGYYYARPQPGGQAPRYFSPGSPRSRGDRE